MLYDNLAVNEQGHLTVGGLDTVALAEEFGAPLYVLDEDKLRENCRTYVQALRENMPEGSYPLFAGKALCFKGLYPVLNEEGMGADVVSPGEIYTALAGGFPAEKLYFHGNNKTDEDIAYALDSHVGCFIVDNHQELARLDEAAGVRGIRQRVLLRVTPGIDPHTLQAINTGRIDCQFGVPIETGQAARFVADALGRKNLIVEGFHSHIGSQIFEAEPFCDAVDILLDFAQAMRQAHGFVAETLNLGGGFGVRYLESDPVVDIPGNIRALAEHLRQGQFQQYDGIFLILDQEDIYTGETLELPETLCVRLRFRGSHAEAPAQYQKLLDYIDKHKMQIVGFSREVTLIDYGLTNDTEKFVTEICIPVTEEE